jgi:epsilon-lactone hydrolase
VKTPPIRVHVAEDDVLLDDSRRFVEHAVAPGADAELDVGKAWSTASLEELGGSPLPRERSTSSGHFLTKCFTNSATQRT